MMLPAAASEVESKARCSSCEELLHTMPQNWACGVARTQTPAWLCATLAQSACPGRDIKSREVSGKYHSDASVTIVPPRPRNSRWRSRNPPHLLPNISIWRVGSRPRILLDEGSSSHQPHAAHYTYKPRDRYFTSAERRGGEVQTGVGGSVQSQGEAKEGSIRQPRLSSSSSR